MTLSSQTFAWVTGIFVVGSAFEWAGLCGWPLKITRILYTIFTIFLLLIAYSFRHELNILYILLGACIWWVVAFFWVLRCQQGQFSLPTSPLVKAFLGVLFYSRHGSH
ncbi:membrane protein [Beggiatoa sp. PS]|nr:membrane protein [Beggiatoa sp. PS]